MKFRLLPLAIGGVVVFVAACGGSEQVGVSTTISTTESAPTTQREVVVERNIAFATFEDTTLTVDLYVPADPSDAPIAIDPWYADEIAEAGAIVAAVQQGVPDPEVDDVAERYISNHGAQIRAGAEATACAIRFARARASELGSDDPTVVIAGFSAGGGVAAHVALFGTTLEERWEEFAATAGGPSSQVECMVSGGSTHVDALVGGAGAYDLYVPVIEGLYGRTFVREHDSELQQFLAGALGAHPELTVRLTHGTADAAIPMTVSADFEEALAGAGYDVQLVSYDGGHTAPPAEIGLEIFTELLGL